MRKTYKLLLLGDSNTGKTSVLNVYKTNTFYDNEINTIGVEFIVKNIYINEEEIKLQIWDTAGQERFRSITLSYYRGSSGVIILFDITNRQSFINIQKWTKDIEKYAL